MQLCSSVVAGGELGPLVPGAEQGSGERVRTIAGPLQETDRRGGLLIRQWLGEGQAGVPVRHIAHQDVSLLDDARGHVRDAIMLPLTAYH